jgi:hypothetical protein
MRKILERAAGAGDAGRSQRTSGHNVHGRQRAQMQGRVETRIRPVDLPGPAGYAARFADEGNMVSLTVAPSLYLSRSVVIQNVKIDGSHNVVTGDAGETPRNRC